MQIVVDHDAEPGVYLHFQDGRVLEITRLHVDATSRKWLNDPTLLPLQVRSATAYQPCSICPARASTRMCHALGPSLAFFDQIDQFDSFTPVTVVFVSEASGATLMKKTSMQRALQYLTLLSVMDYCESGYEFQPFFANLNPLMEPEEFADAIFRNIYYHCRGNLTQVRALVTRLINQLRITSHCQVNRTRLVYQRDALVNAYIATITIADFLCFRLKDFPDTAEAAPT